MSGLREPALRLIYRAGFWVLWLTAYLTRPHSRGVKGVLCNGGEVLLVRHTYGIREWELPGGGQRRHELASEALVRELREELEVELGELDPLGTCNGPGQYSNAVVTFFAARLANRDVRPDPVEIAEVAWCDPAAPLQPLGWYAAQGLARAAKSVA